MTTLSWQKLLCSQRLSRHYRARTKARHEEPPGLSLAHLRNDIERDHDRILFSTPFRRLGDKTQVFPLESIESIRTRLTHSYEVANLARSIGTRIVSAHADDLPSDANRTIPAALAAVGLAHDLGNPPFGHQGEVAIRTWFARNRKRVFCSHEKNSSEMNDDISSLSPQHKNDFLSFEGNAQTLRLITRLQVISDDLGLNLTACTLASMMKYVAASNEMNASIQACKKNGYFASEEKVVSLVREYVGLSQTTRHPLALVMEACDDIAYSVIDTEDAVKKDLVSFSDLMTSLRILGEVDGSLDPIVAHLCEYAEGQHKGFLHQNLHPGELNDVAMQLFRTRAIHMLVTAVTNAFSEHYVSIMNGTFSGTLIDASLGHALCDALKRFDYENAYKHRSVLEIELDGHNVINRLMDFLWQGISHRQEYAKLAGRRRNPFAEYVYSRISRNYRRVFEGKIANVYNTESLPIRYRELQLLTDMISGMTDQFCIDLYEDLNRYYTKTSPVDGTFT